MTRAERSPGARVELLRTLALGAWIVSGIFAWGGIGYWCANQVAAASGWAFGLIFVLAYIVFTLAVLSEVIEQW